jgi:hypothetical protein
MKMPIVTGILVNQILQNLRHAQCACRRDRSLTVLKHQNVGGLRRCILRRDVHPVLTHGVWNDPASVQVGAFEPALGRIRLRQGIGA